MLIEYSWVESVVSIRIDSRCCYVVGWLVFALCFCLFDLVCIFCMALMVCALKTQTSGDLSKVFKGFKQD